MSQDQHPHFYLGIDGGGSRTRAVLVDEHGAIRGAGTAGPSNIDDLGHVQAQHNIRLAVEGCWAAAGISSRPAQGVFLGMAGVVSDSDRAIIRQIAAELHLAPEGQVEVDHDIRIALAGGLAGEPGVVVIIGTGSSCYGRNSAGASCRVGGWGHLLDDVGSGYFLGLQAMIAAVRAADGRGPATRLAASLLPALEIESLDLIMHRLYFQGLSRSQIAALAPLVLEAARQGDAPAQAILAQGAEEVAGMVVTASRRLDLKAENLRVTFTGGLVQASPDYRERITAGLLERLPGVQVVAPLLPPVVGAALLALQNAGISINPQVLRNLSEGDLLAL